MTETQSEAVVNPTVREFVFPFGSKGQASKLTVPVPIPLNTSVNDLAGRLINAHRLPCYIETALREKLEDFVEEETRKLEDERTQRAIEVFCRDSNNLKKYSAFWSKCFSEEVAANNNTDTITNEDVFSEVYHALIHSAALSTLLNLEQSYSVLVQDMLQQREQDLERLEVKQQQEMEAAVQQLGVSYTDDQVNRLAQTHFENTQILESKWASELSNLLETQKREYREWVMNVHEETQAKADMPEYFNKLHKTPLSARSPPREDRQAFFPQASMIEESFTIHLGAQLKTMHNLRLISGDVIGFCKQKPTSQSDNVLQPQRLQTAMSLYSNSLNGLVLLVDNRLNSYVGIKRDFSRVCQQAADFHFLDLEQQFGNIEEQVVISSTVRTPPKMVAEDGDKVSLKSTGSSSSEREDRPVKMQCGDVYITKHSNLAKVHVVFHLVIDESVQSSDLSSRHSVILGYRNILKACFRYDISVITFPLLLAHEMSEEMTIPWCLKRAELVFKCVKGFMMELATWGGTDSRTIQFLLPHNISHETFSAISNMLPSIFRMSNPVKQGAT